MAFIGNLAAAYSARAIGDYNAQMYQQQAAYAKQQAVMREKAYNQLDRPRIVKKQSLDFSNFFVNVMRSGVEFTGTPYEVAMAYKFNQATDLAVSDYNENMDNIDMVNRSLLLEAKGMGEEFRGRLTARAEYIKTGGSLLTMAMGGGVS